MRTLAILFVVSAVLGGAPPAASVPGGPPSSVVVSESEGDVDDFEFRSFDAVYELGRDDAGRSELTVTETLVAEFPDADQNRGIRRELVDEYDGHPTGIEVLSVEDGEGAEREYESDSDDGALVLTIADDDFVRGEQTYVITYLQHDVTRFFADTDADEFYWDVNGTAWAQPFDTVTATVVLGAGLADALTGEATAVQGSEGSSGAAEAEETADGFVFRADDLAPGENLTFAIGFEPDTFTPRPSGFADAPWPVAALLAALAAVGAAVGGVVLRRTRLRDAPSRGPVVTEFLPPRDASPLLSSVILGKTGSAPTAQILALAVAGSIRVVEVDGGRKQRYRLDYLTDEGTDADGRAFLHALFGSRLTPGEHRELTGSDQKAAGRIAKAVSAASRNAVRDGYRRALPGGLIALVVTVATLAVIATVVFGVLALEGDYGGWVPVVLMVVAFLAAVAAWVVVSRHPLEEKGVALRDHLAGLRRYIQVAEADRIRFLQSPEGAERARIDASDPAQVVELNERLLPYAVLFGQEKRWLAELGRHYEQRGATPDWYAGTGAFNAVAFASGIGSVSTSVASTYSASSGGSTGGAVSGGGGGGGGGGGV